ncbi:hypothetical protein VNO78_21573 [Psophocarpus tetragonolobus]|uniref:Uncharacterized protein n=1 Tax=Psophocarpus tetragonolobus TaxID=3891 RepID=A0AAN9SD22_PSOTE
MTALSPRKSLFSLSLPKSPSSDLAVIDTTSLVPSCRYRSRTSHRQYHAILRVAHHTITGTVNGTFINVDFLQHVHWQVIH